MVALIDPTAGHWPCACVKRKGGVMTHIKLHPPTAKRCRACGATRQASLEAKWVGRPYDQCDCYQLAREVLADLGVELPADPGACLAAEASLGAVVADRPRQGDVLEMDGEGGRTHIGVCLDAWRFVHGVPPTSRIDRIDVWARAGKIRRRIRPRALGGLEASP